MADRMPALARKSSPISAAFRADTPDTWVSQSGWFSITSRVLSPKASTIRWASTGPTPLTVREDR